MAISFTKDKIVRWVSRIEKRRAKLGPDDIKLFNELCGLVYGGTKLDGHWEKILIELERKV